MGTLQIGPVIAPVTVASAHAAPVPGIADPALPPGPGATPSHTPPIPASTAGAPTAQAGMAPTTKQRPQDIEQMRARLEEAVGRLYEQAKNSATNVSFNVDMKANRLVVKVTNKETGELIRQIPAEAVIRVADSIDEMRGLLVDERR